MKWINKTHEFDSFFDKFKNKFKNNKLKIYIYGEYRERFKQKLIDLNVFAGVIDSIEYFMERNDGIIVIDEISCYKNLFQYNNMLVSMKRARLKQNLDYFICDQNPVTNNFFTKVFPILYVYLCDKIYISNVQTLLTPRCTLSCKECCNGSCNWNKQDTSKDIPLNELKKSVDTMFTKLDYVDEYCLIGGETLLYPYLTEIIEYIGTKYYNKYNMLKIPTNSTIIPSDNLLKACKKYKVKFYVSNYSLQIPKLKDNLFDISCKLLKHKIPKLMHDKNRQWIDYKFMQVCNEKEDLINYFDYCIDNAGYTRCFEFRDSKFYFCAQATNYCISSNLNYHENDYFDCLKNFNKKEFIEYLLGYSDKGYVDMCKYCNKDKFIHLIPAGEQKNGR